ncbi:MAG: hypothetical protein ACRDH9_11690 [Actinomycetota bacterium]
MITAALVACGGGGGSGSGDTPTFTLPDLTEDPGAFNGERVIIKGGYYGAFEISVLTSGFMESFPPQPVGPLVWVGVSPPTGCLQNADMGARWAEKVEATGIFRYDPDGGFGHLGAYEVALDDATISCA